MELSSGLPKTNAAGGREEVLNPGLTDYTSSALTTRPHRLLNLCAHFPWLFSMVSQQPFSTQSICLTLPLVLFLCVAAAPTPTPTTIPTTTPEPTTPGIGLYFVADKDPYTAYRGMVLGIFHPCRSSHPFVRLIQVTSLKRH